MGAYCKNIPLRTAHCSCAQMHTDVCKSLGWYALQQRRWIDGTLSKMTTESSPWGLEPKKAVQQDKMSLSWLLHPPIVALNFHHGLSNFTLPNGNLNAGCYAQRPNMLNKKAMLPKIIFSPPTKHPTWPDIHSLSLPHWPYPPSVDEWNEGHL